MYKIAIPKLASPIDDSLVLSYSTHYMKPTIWQVISNMELLVCGWMCGNMELIPVVATNRDDNRSGMARVE